MFVDTDLGLPVYAQRALYVALPEQEELKELTTRGGDGYALDPRIILKDVEGYPGDLIDRRLQVAARLLSGAEPSPADLAAVSAAGPHAYLVLRPGPADAARTRRTPFPVVFENSAATVVELPH